MKVIELIAQVRDNLQDSDANYWHDSELLNLYNECKRNISAERQEINSTKTVVLTDSTYEYTVDGVLRYISAKDSNGNDLVLYADDGTGDDDEYGIIIQSYDSIYVNSPATGVTITFKVISFPNDDNLNTTIRSGDENTYKYYILSKAYEKESDMENFQKSGYFWGMFKDSVEFLKKNAKMNYIDATNITKGYFY